MTRYFTATHQWIEVEGDLATVGLTGHGQALLGSAVFAQMPLAGRTLAKGEEAAIVESVKAASAIPSPVSGTVVDGNAAVEVDPALINADPEGAGWLFRVAMAEPTELDATIDGAAYREFLTNPA